MIKVCRAIVINGGAFTVVVGMQGLWVSHWSHSERYQCILDARYKHCPGNLQNQRAVSRANSERPGSHCSEKHTLGDSVKDDSEKKKKRKKKTTVKNFIEEIILGITWNLKRWSHNSTSSGEESGFVIHYWFIDKIVIEKCYWVTTTVNWVARHFFLTETLKSIWKL